MGQVRWADLHETMGHLNRKVETRNKFLTKGHGPLFIAKMNCRCKGGIVLLYRKIGPCQGVPESNIFDVQLNDPL